MKKFKGLLFEQKENGKKVTGKHCFQIGDCAHGFLGPEISVKFHSGEEMLTPETITKFLAVLLAAKTDTLRAIPGNKSDPNPIFKDSCNIKTYKEKDKLTVGGHPQRKWNKMVLNLNKALLDQYPKEVALLREVQYSEKDGGACIEEKGNCYIVHNKDLGEYLFELDKGLRRQGQAIQDIVERFREKYKDKECSAEVFSNFLQEAFAKKKKLTGK